MSYASHLRESYGLPVFDFPDPDDEKGTDRLPEADTVAWRISSDAYDAKETWPEAFARFAAAVDTTRVRAIVVGAWEEAYDSGPEEIIAALLAAGPRLPALRALFLGDMESEECEISWINQGDLGPLLDGFPELEEFGVRGGSCLVLPPFAHQRLRSSPSRPAAYRPWSSATSPPATCPPCTTSSSGSARRTTAGTAS